MSKTKEILKQLNPDLFSEILPAAPYEVLVSVAEEIKKDGEVTKYKFTQKVTREIPGIPAGSLYLRVMFKKAGAIVKDLVVGGEKRTAFRGSKKAQAGNVFKNQQTELFNFLVEELKAGNYTVTGKDMDGNIQVTCHAVVFGRKISVNTPSYTPRRVNKETGERIEMKATRFNPETNKYEPEQKVVMGVFEFFADEEDLEKLLEVAGRLVEKQVMPYLTKTVETKVSTANEVTVKVEEEKLSSAAEVAEGEGESEEEELEV